MYNLQGLKVTTFKTMNENTEYVFQKDDLILILQRRTPSTKKALPMSQGCHLEAAIRTSTTPHTRWCHSLRKKERVRGRWKRDRGGQGVWKRENRQERMRGRERRWCHVFRAVEAVFVQTLSLKLCRSTLRIWTPDTTEVSVWYSYDVII